MRIVAPSKVPTTCDQLFSGSAGPSSVRSAPAALRSRNLATPPSRKSMYWLLAQPSTVFSRIPPFCEALGRTQASTETALRISRLAALGTVTVTDPEKAAAVSPAIAPGWPRRTPGSYTPLRPLPLEAAATLLDAASPSRQNPLGRSASSPAVIPASSTPRAQLTVWPWVLQLPWLTVAAPALSPAARVTTRVTPLARAGPLLVSAYWYVRLSPIAAGSGDTLPERARSASGALIVLSKLSVLFVVSGSLSLAVACAVLRCVPAAVAVAVRRRLAPPPW